MTVKEFANNSNVSAENLNKKQYSLIQTKILVAEASNSTQKPIPINNQKHTCMIALTQIKKNYKVSLKSIMRSKVKYYADIIIVCAI